MFEQIGTVLAGAPANGNVHLFGGRAVRAAAAKVYSGAGRTGRTFARSYLLHGATN